MLIRTVALAALIQNTAAVAIAPFENVKNNNAQTPRFLGSGDSSGGDSSGGDDEGDDGDYSADLSFLRHYNIMYENCFAADNIVTFKLCPNGHSCRHDECDDGGEYMVDFDFFLDAFTELQLGAKEYACEMMREKCIADGFYSDDSDNFDLCYQYQGHLAGGGSYDYSYCMSNTNEDFELQSYLGCRSLSLNGTSYYTAPYCDDSDAFSIYMGLFQDDACSERAELDEEEVEELLAGDDLPFMPFMKELDGDVVISNECANCREHGLDQDKNGGDDADDEDEVIQQCEELYEVTADSDYSGGRCETYYMNDEEHAIDQSGCSTIGSMKQQESHFTSRNDSNYVVRKNRAPQLIGMLILGIAATVIVVGGAYVVYKKARGNSGLEGTAVNTTPLV